MCMCIATCTFGNILRFQIIPIEGDFEVNDEPQKSFTDILPEIVISKLANFFRLS